MTDELAVLFRIEAGLLAYILAFYALCARDRRARYITHTVYAETGLVLFAVIATMLASFTPSFFANLNGLLLYAAQFVLVAAAILTLKRTYSIANHDLRLRDDRWWIMLPLINQLYLWRRRRKHEKAPGVSYEHQSLAPSAQLKNAIQQAGWKLRGSQVNGDGAEGAPEASFTLSLYADTYHQSDQHLLQLVVGFLREGAFVQYTPCARHPTEFISKLYSSWTNTATDGGKEWDQIAKQLVIVDAYTPHFGFYDSVHEIRQKFLEKRRAISVIACSATFAGIHSSTAKAFNLIKSRESGGNARKPALLIFEGAEALVDLESQEQYRRFLRHVIPSERMWGSMFTLVVEMAPSEATQRLLESYAEYYLSESKERETGQGAKQ